MTDQNRETLQPGDLCVILDGPLIPPIARPAVGKTVVLIEISDIGWLEYSQWKPYWRCSGLPPNWQVSHVLLRKIPPDRMIDARMHDTPIREPGDEPTVTVHPAGEDVVLI